MWKYQPIRNQFLSVNKNLRNAARGSSDKVLVREFEIRMRGQTPEWRFYAKRARIRMDHTYIKTQPRLVCGAKHSCTNTYEQPL